MEGSSWPSELLKLDAGDSVSGVPPRKTWSKVIKDPEKWKVSKRWLKTEILRRHL